MCNDRPVEVLEVCDRGTTVRYRDHTGKMFSAATGLVEETTIAAGDRIVVRGGYVFRVLTPDEAQTITEIHERFSSCK